MSFAAKNKDDHTDDDVQAMKQLGAYIYCSMCATISLLPLYLLLALMLCDTLIFDIFSLGEWLRDQNTMEDTITILQKEGWMA